MKAVCTEGKSTTEVQTLPDASVDIADEEIPCDRITNSSDGWRLCVGNMSALMVIPTLSFLAIFPMAFYHTITFDSDSDIAIDADRPYNSSPYFAGNHFRNEFGIWYGIILILHVCSGVIAVSLLSLPLLLTTKGKAFFW